MTQKIKLTDLQLVLLSAAAARSDLMLLPPPESVQAAGETLERTLAQLFEAALVEEAVARHDAETWRESGEGDRLGLRIAPAGLEAIGLAPDAAEEGGDAEAEAAAAELETGAGTEPAEASAAALPVRPGTKQARLAQMISAPGGAGLAALCEALGWQAHTTRAAMTGLRRKGLAIESARDAEGATVYRLSPTTAPTDAA